MVDVFAKDIVSSAAAGLASNGTDVALAGSMHRKSNRRLAVTVWGLCLLSPLLAHAQPNDQTVRVSIEIDQPEQKRQTIVLEVPIDGELSARGSLSGRAVYCRAVISPVRREASSKAVQARVECGHDANDPDGLFEITGQPTLPSHQTKKLGSIESTDGSKIRVKLRRS